MSVTVILNGNAIQLKRGKTATGRPYLRFRAYARRKARDGSLKTDFYTVFYMGSDAETLEAWEKEVVSVQGTLVMDEYVGRDGVKRVNPVILADSVTFMATNAYARETIAPDRQLHAMRQAQIHDTPQAGDHAYDDIPF